MARRYDTRRIKKNRSYSVEELAEALAVTHATVRNWIKAGLQLLDQNRPQIMLGFHIQDFLQNQRQKAKRPLADGEVYCLRCKAPRMPDGLMADYEPTSVSGGRLKALCEVCEGLCNRNVNAQQLQLFSNILEIVPMAVNEPKGTPQTPLEL
jgi:hypothetical protein